MLERLNIDAGADEVVIRDWSRYPDSNAYTEVSCGAVKNESLKVTAETHTETLQDGSIAQIGVTLKGECELLQTDSTSQMAIEGLRARGVDLVIYNRLNGKMYTCVDTAVQIVPNFGFSKKGANAAKLTFQASALTMSEIFAQNDLKKDKDGNENEMVWIPKFNFDPATFTISGSTPHPAFIVNGAEKKGFWAGKYQASGTPARSVPGVDVAHTTTFDGALAACAALNNGSSVTGWHMMTNAEWAAAAIYSKLIGKTVYGNNNFGADVDAKLTGKIAPGSIYGSGTSKWLTGSGGRLTSHDNTPGGIYDMNGNVWEWVGGMRMMNGIVNVLADNNAADTTKSQAAGSSEWKAINNATGALIAYDAAGSVRIGAVGSAASLQVGTGAPFESMINVVDNIGIIKSLCIYPPTSGLGGDGIWYDVTGERLPFRGGPWLLGVAAGVFSLNLDSTRSAAYTNVGFRLALLL